LSLLLVAVLMTVSNIQGAIDLLPASEYGNKGHHVENIMQSTLPLQSPSSSKRDFAISESRIDAPTSFSAHDDVVTSKKGTESTSLSLLQELPNSNNTVIAIISMGKLVEKYLLERCIRSLRVRGDFQGYIMVFTDETGYQTYQRSMAWDPKTKVMLGWKEDMIPMINVTISENEKGKGNGTPFRTAQKPIEYAQKTMIFKRFKTHHAKYVASDPELVSANIRYVLYVDVDIVVTNSLSGFFHDYGDMVLREYNQWASKLRTQHLSTDFGFFSLFVDRHLKGKMHTGIILSDLKFHDKCAESWRKEMDEFYHKSDQVMLLNVIGNYSTYGCKAFELPAHHFSFANKRIMEQRKPSSLPTFVHITEFRIRRIKDSDLHQGFLRFILDLKGNKDTLDGVSWEQAISPEAKRKQLQEPNG
jgi:hypothetical protein